MILSRTYSKSHFDDESATMWPYRTTPLVLPGAKVKHEPTLTECYLRHHPNPSVRARPHHIDTDYLLKQKVANSVLQRIGADDPNKQVVHKQFNSPIGLYSDANVADTLHKQTGISPKKNLKYNPAESETYKAIQEQSLSGGYMQEVPTPAQSRVFAPNKTIPARKPVYHQPQPTYVVNSMGEPEEKIHQSGSFKRLMWSVMSE